MHLHKFHAPGKEKNFRSCTADDTETQRENTQGGESRFMVVCMENNTTVNK